jgi:hypothetical protein
LSRDKDRCLAAGQRRNIRDVIEKGISNEGENEGNSFALKLEFMRCKSQISLIHPTSADQSNLAKSLGENTFLLDDSF